MIALMNPEESWVARWQRTGKLQLRPAMKTIGFTRSLEKFVRGMYAVRVTGRIPADVQDALAARNITYRPRDQTSEF
jgi:transcription elongation factor SPT4